MIQIKFKWIILCSGSRWNPCPCLGPHTLATAVRKKDYKAKCEAPPLQKIGCQYTASVNANTQLPIRMHFIQKKQIPMLLEHAHINTRGLSMFAGLLSTLVCFGKSRLLQKVCTMQNLRWETSACFTCTCPLQWWMGVFCSRHSWEGWSEDGRIAVTKLAPPPINDLVIFLDQRMVISDPVAFKQSASLTRSTHASASHSTLISSGQTPIYQCYS